MGPTVTNRISFWNFKALWGAPEGEFLSVLLAIIWLGMIAHFLSR